MTESLNSKSTFLYTFLTTLKKNFYFIIIGCVGIFGFIGFDAIDHVVSFKYRIEEALREGLPAPKITDFTKFYLFDSEYSFVGLALAVGVIGLAGILGLFLFRFITSKKTVNVYYSLGVTRANLFLPKITAGMLILFLAIALPLLALAFVNVYAYGSSKELWQAVFYMITSYTTMAFISLGVTSAVFATVGTLGEGLVFSSLILLSPTIFLYFLQHFMQSLIYGSPYGYYMQKLHGDYFSYSAETLSSKLSYIDPFRFNSRPLALCSSMTRESAAEKFEFTAPGFWPVLIWALIAVATFAFGTWMFHRRKAERAGFLGTNRPLNFLVTAIAGVGAFCFCIAILPWSNFVKVAIGLALYTIVYFVFELVLHRSFKVLKKNLLQWPLHLVLACALFTIFYTGLFGYSGKTPDFKEVESVSVTPVASAQMMSELFGKDGRSYSHYPMDDKEFALNYFYLSEGYMMIDEIKDENTIKKIISIQEEIAKKGRQTSPPFSKHFGSADDGVRTSAMFIYTMKDGSQFARAYDSTTVEMLEKLALMQTEYLNPALRSEFLTQPEKGANHNDYYENPNDYFVMEMFYNDAMQFVLSDSHLNKSTVLTKLTKEDRLELIQIIRKDLDGMSAEQQLFPSGKTLGTLVLTDTSVEGGSSLGIPSYSTAIEVSDRFGHVYQCMDPASSRYRVILTAEMKGTLQYLSDHGYAKALENNTKFVSARVYPAVKSYYMPDSDSYSSTSSTPEFIGASLKRMPDRQLSEEERNYMGYMDIDLRLPEDAYEVKDAALVAQMEANAQLYYFNSRDGFIVEFTDDADWQTYLYVPAQSMPQSVANAALGK